MDGKGAKWAETPGFLASQNMASPSAPNTLKKYINFPNTFSTYKRYTHGESTAFLSFWIYSLSKNT